MIKPHNNRRNPFDFVKVLGAFTIFTGAEVAIV